MNYKQILNRFTGFSTPVFGVSWTPAQLEVDAARRVIAFLEDRRVLYSPYALESESDVARSVIEIREMLTAEIGALTGDSQLKTSLRAMRAACRKYLDQSQTIRPWPPPWAGLAVCLGELRGVVGMHIAAIAGEFGVAVEDELAQVLPGEDIDGQTPRG